MSILLKWKNKLQDPSLNETKIREFDERVSLLKNENVELHKRIDQLEALCTTSVDTQQARFLEEHVRQLEQENGRLFTENQCQRQEYERFLDQLTAMVVRTAVMQENIRTECTSIYHVIERLSSLTANAIQDKPLHQIEHRTKRLRSLSWENLNQPCELISNYQLLSTSHKTTADFIRQFYQNRSSLPSSTSSSSSCSSANNHCSISTSGSWTLDLALFNQNKTIQSPILPLTKESTESQTILKEAKEEEEQQVLQRSETFVVAKIPQEESSASSCRPQIKPMIANERTISSNVQRCPTTRTMTATIPVVARPSRLPSRCSTSRNTNSNTSSTSKISSPNHTNNNNNNNNNNTNRSLSMKKASKLPIRTTTSLTKPVTPVKKSNVPTSVAVKTKRDSTVASIRPIAPMNNNSTTKKIVRPSTAAAKLSVVQNSVTKPRSRSTATVPNNSITTLHPVSTTNKRTRTIPPVVKKAIVEPCVSSKKLTKPMEAKPLCPVDQMNSTSSESSIEEHEQINKLLTIVQDEGYSTWSSSDVKDEMTSNSLKKIGTEERKRNTGLVKNWLDTTNKRCARKPVKEVEIDKLEEFSRELSDGSSIICPFVRNRCSNGIIIPLASTNLSPGPLSPPPLPDKDISLDSLDGDDSSQPQEQTVTSPSSSSTSSTTFSRSETFEKVHVKTSLPIISDDLDDSTDSTCSDLNQLSNMSDYIEDHFLDQDSHCNEHLSLGNPIRSIKPRKRLMFPGLLNRLIFLRRVLSDSDLQQKVCCIGENEIQYHVYHSNTINEHSIELNLLNTYGSQSELNVWSHDCAEQRRFAEERQHHQEQLLVTAGQSQPKLSHIERMIRMTLDDCEEDESNILNLNNEEYDQQLALERQTILQQIYEYPWLLQDDDLDQATVFSSPNSEQPLLSPSPDLVVPSHNPDFYQLCALTNSSSFATSYGTNSRHTTPPIASSVL